MGRGGRGMGVVMRGLIAVSLSGPSKSVFWKRYFIFSRFAIVMQRWRVTLLYVLCGRILEDGLRVRFARGRVLRNGQSNPCQEKILKYHYSSKISSTRLSLDQGTMNRNNHYHFLQLSSPKTFRSRDYEPKSSSRWAVKSLKFPDAEDCKPKMWY